jgi:hypothetical protein
MFESNLSLDLPGFFAQLYSPRPFSTHHSSAEHVLVVGTDTNLKVPLVKSHLCVLIQSPFGNTSPTFGDKNTQRYNKRQHIIFHLWQKTHNYQS